MQVLLLDEITVDMDVVGRLDLLQFFKEECAERGATIIYVRAGVWPAQPCPAAHARGQACAGGPLPPCPAAHEHKHACAAVASTG